MYFVVEVILDTKGVSLVSACRVGFTEAVVLRDGFLVWTLTVVVVSIVVDVVELDPIPGSMSSLGFIENPVSVEFFTGATVALLGEPVAMSSIVLYPAII